MNTKEAIWIITSSDQYIDCSVKYPPVGDGVVQIAEQNLGYPLPEILRTLFTTVANGGFGPGYGVIGIQGGHLTDEGDSSIDLYTIFSEADPEDPNWKWPPGLLPLCHWGCAIYSCVDCSTHDGQIVWFDPNAHELDETWGMAFRKQSIGVVEFLVTWAQGQDHWKKMYET